ncbi:DUF3015 family protein [Candidatus Methylospira mobilis]|uniref:DUF3015 family protein n=1 Tax=Candidatus Methylospira mobilis TaxID=1808979 RepID=UPI0028ECE8E1|nr:DUF3015 family protein [Candidatus Methylospira mobilis]WNV05596.1 DUF3015 family protein [Candidatus Methylospira mobilis]
MRRIITVGLLLVMPVMSSAAEATTPNSPSGYRPTGDGVGGCGWGALLFEGSTGVGAHVMALSTNVSLSDATFGLSSGTLGCDAHQPIRYKGGRVYISGNMTQLAEDMSQGHGEALAGLSDVLGIQAQDKAAFYTLTQQQFVKIYPDAKVTSDQVMDHLVAAMLADPALAKYVL